MKAEHIEFYKCHILLYDECDNIMYKTTVATLRFEKYVEHWILHDTKVIVLTATPTFSVGRLLENQLVFTWW